MSSDWGTYRFDEAGRIVTGKTPRGGIPEFDGAEVPFVTPPDFSGNKRIARSVRAISEAGAQSVKGSIIPARSVLVTCIGSDMGKTALTSSRCVANQQINAIVVDESRFAPEFLYYNLSLRKAEIRSLAGGSAQPIMNKSAFGRLSFKAPSLAEQRRIVEAMAPIDDRIALLRETNTTLEAIAQSLHKSWFVDFNPVHANKQGIAPEGMDEATAALFPEGFEESDLGLVPRGWSQSTLYDLATYVNGAAYKTFAPNLERRGLPIIKIAELKAGVSSQTAFSDVTMPAKYRIETGEILFSWSGNPDTSIDTFVWPHAPALLNQHIFRVLPHAAEERSLVLRTLRYLRPVFAELARNKQTTGLGHVTVADLKRLKVVRPPSAVLRLFDGVVAPIQDAMLNNEQIALNLGAIRDTLLPRLISGQLRIPDAEALIQ